MIVPVAVYDANVLFSASLREFLVWLGVVGACRPLWTDMIHREWIENVLIKRPQTERSKLERTRELMDINLPAARVEGFESLIPSLVLPDENDRHVLAAAIQGEANFIVTFNLSDFPANVVGSHGIEPIHPDDFVVALLESDAEPVLTAVSLHRANLKKNPKSVEQYLGKMELDGLKKTAAILRPSET
jgi:hypothetical protein